MPSPAAELQRLRRGQSVPPPGLQLRQEGRGVRGGGRGEGLPLLRRAGGEVFLVSFFFVFAFFSSSSPCRCREFLFSCFLSFLFSLPFSPLLVLRHASVGSFFFLLFSLLFVFYACFLLFFAVQVLGVFIFLFSSFFIFFAFLSFFFVVQV